MSSDDCIVEIIQVKSKPNIPLITFMALLKSFALKNTHAKLTKLKVINHANTLGSLILVNDHKR